MQSSDGTGVLSIEIIIVKLASARDFSRVVDLPQELHYLLVKTFNKNQFYSFRERQQKTNLGTQ